MPYFLSRSFGSCPSTVTSEASTTTPSMKIDAVILKKDAETQTEEQEEKKIMKRSRYIEMRLDESDDE